MLYMVFDVESAGLHGRGFAFGYVVVDENGHEVDCGGARADQPMSVSDANREWLDTHVTPVIEELELMPERALRRFFWSRWMRWKAEGAQLVTDCGWPVEANFLSECVADDIEGREWEGPYPLLDLSSVLLAAGKNPAGTFERLPNELPAHHPIRDARQSARVLVETLAELRAPAST